MLVPILWHGVFLEFEIFGNLAFGIFGLGLRGNCMLKE